MLLDQLPRNQSAHIDAIDWSVLSESEGQRLRALGIDEGAVIATAHRGVFFGRDPMAVCVGRMMVALRRAHARAITVTPLEEKAAASVPDNAVPDGALPDGAAAA